MVAAWRLHCKTCQENLLHLQFCSKITLCLLKAGPQPVRKLEWTGILPEEVRYDGMDHTLGSKSQGRCKVCSKKQKICLRNVMYGYMPKKESYVLKNIIANQKNHNINL